MSKLGVGEYHFSSVLGKGCYGEVYKATRKDKRGVEYAVKVITKASLNRSKKLTELFETEVKVMRDIEHPNIMRCYELLETGSNYYMILQYCNGGDLESHVKKHLKLDEQDAIYFLKQILNGFCELHARKIMHRDFKLANILLHNDQAVIGDFGFAKSGVELTHTKLGSPLTMAPEVLMGENKDTYDSKVDIWSIGMVFYHMIYGSVPWDVVTQEELKGKIRVASGEMLPFLDKIKVSQQCKDLLKKMLQQDPVKRISWEDLFGHPLFTDKKAPEPEPISEPTFNLDSTPVMDSSFGLKPHESVVQQLFTRNKQGKGISAIFNNTNALGIFKEKTKEPAAIEFCINRYFHEKRVIDFIYESSRRLIKVHKEFGTISHNVFDPFLGLAVILSKKIELMHKILANSLAAKINLFDLPQFEDFAGSEQAMAITKQLMDYHCFYSTNLVKQTKALPEYLRENPNLMSEILTVLRSDTDNLNVIQEELRRLMDSILRVLPSLSKIVGLHLPKIQQYICRAHLSVESEIAFPYLRQDQAIYDWKLIEVSLSKPEYQEHVLKEATAMYGLQHSMGSFTGKSKPVVRINKLAIHSDMYDPSIA